MFDLDLLYDKNIFASLCNSLMFEGKDLFNKDGVQFCEKKRIKELERNGVNLHPVIAQSFLNINKEDVEEDDDDEKLKIEIMFYVAGWNEDTKVDKDMILNVIGENKIQYLRHLEAEERPHPVIAFILNFSNEPYEGPTSLNELITDDIDKFLKINIQPMDWKIHVINLVSFRDNDFNNFNGDFRIALKIWDMIINQQISQIKEFTKGLEIQSKLDVIKFVSKITDYKLDVDTLFYSKKDEKPYYQVYAEEYLAKVIADKDGEIDKKGKLIAEKDKLIAEKDKLIAEKDKLIAKKDKEFEDCIISALKDGSLSDDKIKLIFKISDERLAEIKSKIND